MNETRTVGADVTYIGTADMRTGRFAWHAELPVPRTYITGEDYPVLARLWDNEADAVYDDPGEGGDDGGSHSQL